MTERDNIDKELVAMCDTPEIQDRWEPKVGDRVNCHYGVGLVSRIDAESYKLDNNKFPISAWYYRREDYNHVYIPRIEDVLEWLVPKYWEGWNHAMNAMLEYRFTDDAPARIWYNHLKSWIAFFMHLEHNKSWNGEAWV